MRWETRRFAPALMMLVLLSTMAGCASSSTSSGSPASSTSSATSEATASGTPSPGQTSGQVIITISKDHFGAEEPLTATLHNKGTTSIWTTDHHTGCGLLTLEVSSGGAWQSVGQCAQPRPVKVVEIPAGATEPQAIAYSQEMDMGAGWAAGTYRMSLAYATSQGQANQPAAAKAYSSTFTIG